ncbi:MAG: preprotein translocase subunit SecY [Ilumatobacter fluminis]|uniref:Protein translocase subunit SecY n=1 Tax=Ilumatobacter fluminis TaxID=467091 RepID=A0A4R7HWF4_9ACTN|nr:preprotein translocase subunit SecY [Ilumatobacter fluminis]TDT15351.1 protein translocase subunit secY/sec61 alpha [Ilumatobacter fluminis]
MLSNILNIFKVPDLRNKLLFTFMIVALYRVGAAIRVPGVDPLAIDQLREGSQDGALGLFNLFSGGAFESFSVFALGIMPYITASIIMQVLGVVIPKLEELQQQGAVGQRKITQYTRYVTIALATLQATVLVFLFGTGGGGAFFSAVQAPSVPLLPDGIWPRGYLIIPTLVAGTAVLMWMGEMISQRGIGNGMSMIIFASVVASVPGGFYSILQVNKEFWFVVMIIVSLAIIVAVVFVELGQRRIPVQFAKRVVGRRMMGGQNTYIPLKVNQSGVIPIIFASSILLLPAILASFFGSGDPNADEWSWAWIRGQIQEGVDQYILNSQNIVYVSLFALLIIAFAYFYNSIAFDPVRQADQIRRQGGFIPGVRPGPQTEAYLAKAVNRITLPGAVFIALIAITPYLILWAADVNGFAFAGTSILISVGVSLELMRQIDSQLMLRNYEGFLK